MARKEDNQHWKSVLPAAGLVVLVLLILAITAVVRTEPEPERMPPEGGTTGPLPAPASEPQAEREADGIKAPDIPAAGRTRSVRERANRDYQRLAGMEGSFTAHLMLSCDHDNTRRHMEGAGWHDNLYLLPAEYQGEDCFRLCWGIYPTREAAEAEGAILPYLAREFPDRTPKPFAEIRP